jgi:hemerythrin-like metal-binding protein
MVKVEGSWSERLKTGIDLIDGHHMILLGIMADVKAAMDSVHDREAGVAALSALSSYTKYHFLAEERIMVQCGYPHLEFHKEQHRQFTEKIAELGWAYTKDRETVLRDLLVFLKDWLINHILTMDAKIGYWMRSKDESSKA